MIMNRLYGQHQCHNCRQIPEIGFLYACKVAELASHYYQLTSCYYLGQQDRFLEPNTFPPSMETLPVVADGGTYFEAQAKVAESIGMSRSVIKQMRDGEYDFDQIGILLQQRRHVLEVIRNAENASTLSSKPPSPRKDSCKSESSSEVVIASAGNIAPAVQPVAATATAMPMTPAGTPYNTPIISAMSPSAPKAKSARRTGCNFQVCHFCRPFFPDRLHTSVDAIYNNEEPSINEDDSSSVRVLDANIVSNFGLRPSPPKPVFVTLYQDDDTNSVTHRHHQEDGGDDNNTDISPDWTPTDTTASNDSRFPSESQELHKCPGRGFCPGWSETEGCAYYHGFDDHQRETSHTMYTDDSFDPEALEMAYDRTRRAQVATTNTPEGTSSAGSSISLPEATIEPLTPTTPSFSLFGIDLQNRLNNVGKAATVCGVVNGDRDSEGGLDVPRMNNKDSDSSLGSEVDVDGGVALKEEAVESGVPDIVTSE